MTGTRVVTFLVITYLTGIQGQAETTTEAPRCLNQLTGQSGIFISDNFPDDYATDTDCTWNITVAEDKRVKLTFHLFNVEVNNDCYWDWVKVFDSNGTVLKHLCGYLQQDLVLYSTNNSISVVLHSDHTINAAGFLASWEEVEEEPEEEIIEATDEGYVLSFPQSFTIGSEGKMCLQMLALPTSGDITLSLYGKNGVVSGSPVNSTTVQVNPGNEDLQCHGLTLPLDFDGRYAIVGIKGQIGDYKILSYKSIRVLKSTALNLIQTDKYDYRPGQEVYIRMMLMDQDLKPSKDERINELWIEDPSGSRMSQWKDQPLRKGIIQVSYILDEEPNLGKWLIKAKYGENGTVEGKSQFEVNEVTLPSFEVTLDEGRNQVVLKDSVEETFEVCAKYTHGANVKGQANVTISTKYKVGTYWRAPYSTVSVSRLVDIDGCTEVTLNAEEVQKLTKKSTPLKIEAIVKEEATGEKQEAVKEGIEVKNTAFKIEATTSPTEHILTGFPYVGQMKVVDHEGQAVPRTQINLCARLYTSLQELRDYVNKVSYQFYSFNEEQYFALSQVFAAIKFQEVCQDMTSDANGMINVAVNLANMEIPSNVTKLSLYFAAKDHETNETSGMVQPTLNHEVSLTHTNASSALTLRASTSKLTCGDNNVEVFVSGPANSEIELTHFIASGGVMVASGSSTVQLGSEDNLNEFVGPNAKGITFESAQSREDAEVIILKKHVLNIQRPFKTEVFSLDPVKMLAYVRDAKTGETLTATEDFDPESCDAIAHASTMEFSKEKARPREALSIQMSGPSNGLCGYSIVDKSVALTANPNKVTTSRLKKLREAIIRQRIVNDKISGEKCKDAKLLFRAFEKLGLFVLSDKLSPDTSCDSLIDVTNSAGRDKPDLPSGIPQPVAFLDTRFAASQNFAAAPPPVDDYEDYEQSIASPAEAFEVRPQIAEDVFDNKVAQKPAASNSPGIVEEIEAPEIDLRNYFPETWLFDLVDLDSNGQHSMDVEAPDTVTTWIGDAFCTSSEFGISVAKEQQLVVDQDFFIDMKLPFSIKRDELLPLNVTAFSKLKEMNLPLKIKVIESDGYKLGASEYQVCVKPEDSEAQTFTVKAKELNEVNITVEAVIESFKGCDLGQDNAQGFKDAIQKPIQVRPEGFPVEKVQSEFVCRQAGDEEATIDLTELNIPLDELVEGSARAWVTVSGDVLAPSMNNLDKLVKMPYGCGEQNMISLVPNIYVVKYLEGTGQNKPDLIAKAKKFMKAGYERQEQNYRHKDGSYSIWGPKDEDAEGSVWLTAFVVKAFAQASDYIDIDQENLRQSIGWLKRKQNQDGCFENSGYSYKFDKDSNVALTASLVIAQLDSSLAPEPEKVEEVVEAMKCLQENVKDSSSVYVKALSAYAFALMGETKSEVTDKWLEHLLTIAKTDQPGKMYWKAKENSTVITSEDVEISAYVVLTLVKLNKLPEALSVIRWLATQRNAYGGFKSTQDTMIALQALAEYSLKISEEETSLEIEFEHDDTDDDELDFEVTEDNKLLLQMQKLTLDPTKSASKVSVEVEGSGCFMVQSILRYNVKSSPDATSFDLTISQDQADDKVNFCASYTGTKEKTNMVVIEIELLSGFVPTKDALLSLKNTKAIKKVEYDEKENNIALYFNDMSKSQFCYEFQVQEKNKVEDRQDALAKIYDYYDQNDAFSTKYNISQ